MSSKSTTKREYALSAAEIVKLNKETPHTLIEAPGEGKVLVITQMGDGLMHVREETKET